MRCNPVLYILVVIFFLSNNSFASDYKFGWPYPHFSFAHDISSDGSENEEIYFSVVDADSDFFGNGGSYSSYIPMIGDIISSVRLQGPTGSGIDTEDILLFPDSVLISIEGHYVPEIDRFEYFNTPYTSIGYRALLPEGVDRRQKGNYTLTLRCNNGQELVADQNILNSVNSTILPAPEDVAMTMNGDGSIRVSWSNPIIYDPNTTLRARIECFDKNVFTGFRVRLRKIPSDWEDVTFDKELVDMLKAYGSQFKVKVQAVLLLAEEGFEPSGNYANSEKISYFIDNNVLVKRDYQPDTNVVVIPLR